MQRKPLRTDVAVATYLGWDVAEVREYRYQQHRTPCAIFSVRNEYLTATTGRPPKSNADWQWERVDSWLTEAYGNVIWKAVTDADS